MKIGIDARCLEENRISGVGEYTLELLTNMFENDSENEYFVFSNSFRQVGSQHIEQLKKYPYVELKRFSFPNKILNLFFWYFGWPKIDRLLGGVDVFFAPNMNFLSLSKNCPLIVTFHDLSFERYSQFFPLKTRLWHKYFVNPRRIARRAKKIIAVSESTKNDLIELYGIKPEKIEVIHHGISGDFQTIDRNSPKLLEIQKKYNLPYKFILYLGNIEPRKNISSIINAYKILVSMNHKFSKYKLVLAGNISPMSHDEIEKEKIVICGYIERKDRPLIYNLASLFVYPSFFEGFGLPVLEAMACSTSVITSNNSSIPEMAGNAAILIDPNRPTEIAEAMKNILTDEKLHNTTRERGLTQTHKFSWKECAEKTFTVIANAAKQSHI